MQQRQPLLVMGGLLRALEELSRVQAVPKVSQVLVVLRRWQAKMIRLRHAFGLWFAWRQLAVSFESVVGRLILWIAMRS